MAEISLNKQLSGPEALHSMMRETEMALARNGRFQGHMAYSGYRAEVTVKFYPAMSFVPDFEQTITLDKVPEGDVLSQTATVDAVVEIPVRSPNETRESADMPLPYLTQDANGNPVEKWVKRGPGRPKNKVVGGNSGKEPATTMVPTAIR